MGAHRADHLKVGEWGEQEAARYLKSEGYKILGMRVRLDARDELDVVARDGETLVFVEVKTRKHEQYGRPIAAVDRAKRHTLSRAAVRYIKRLKNRQVCFRFDVVEVVGQPGAGVSKLRHTRNAFPLDRRYSLPA